MKLSHTRTAIRTSLLLAGACITWAETAAQGSAAAWRCGNTYSDQPCHGGQALDLDDARSAQQKRDADQATRDVRAEATRMERERLRLEATQGPGQASLIDNAPRPRHASAERGEALLKKPKTRKDLQYVSPQAEPKPKRRSRKAAKD